MKFGTKKFGKSAYTYDGYKPFKIIAEKADKAITIAKNAIKGTEQDTKIEKKNLSIFCGPLRESQHTIAELSPTTDPGELPPDLQRFVEDKWTPQSQLTVFDPKAKKALTASEAKDMKSGNPRWMPQYFQNPMQSYDYLVYESLIKNTILGPAMKSLIKYIMGTGFKPELELRMPTKDKLKDKAEIDKHEYIISQLLYVDRLVSEKSDTDGIDTTFKTKITNMVHNMLVFNRSCAVFVYDEKNPIKMKMFNEKGVQDGEEKIFKNIPTGLVDFHPRDMGIVKISPDSHKMVALQIQQFQGMIDVDKMIYMWNAEYSAPIYNSKYYGGSMMMPMIDPARLIRNQISSILPAVAENMAGGLYHIFVKPQGNNEQQKRAEYEDITKSVEFGTSNVFMIDPQDVAYENVNFDPKITELITVFDAMIKYILAAANVPQIGFYDESAANHATAVEKIQLTISTIINPMRDGIGDEISRQWYDRIFRILYADDPKIIEKFRITIGFDDMQVETLRERAEAIEVIERRGPKFNNNKYEEIIQIDGYADDVEGEIKQEVDGVEVQDGKKNYRVKPY